MSTIYLFEQILIDYHFKSAYYLLYDFVLEAFN